MQKEIFLVFSVQHSQRLLHHYLNKLHCLLVYYQNLNVM